MYFDYYTDTDDWYRQEPDPICPMAYIIPYIPPISDFDEDEVDVEDEEGMMRQPPYSVARLLQLFENQSPQSFTQLERYRVPRFFLRRVFRAVIGYVLRNVNVSQPLPQPVNQYARTLLGRLLTARPMFENVFSFFRVPVNITRNILLTLIAFVLYNLPFPGTSHGSGIGREPAEQLAY